MHELEVIIKASERRVRSNQRRRERSVLLAAALDALNRKTNRFRKRAKFHEDQLRVARDELRQHQEALADCLAHDGTVLAPNADEYVRTLTLKHGTRRGLKDHNPVSERMRMHRRVRATYLAKLPEEPPVSIPQRDPAEWLLWLLEELDFMKDEAKRLRDEMRETREHRARRSARRELVTLLDDMDFCGASVTLMQLAREDRGPGRPRDDERRSVGAGAEERAMAEARVREVRPA